MSQRMTMTIFSIGLVAVLGVATLLNYGITTSIVAAAQLTGPAGPIGADGADGAAGPQGPQGIPGVDGKDGAPGATGSGTRGAPGPAGAPGLNGAPGADGENAEASDPVSVSTGSFSGPFSSGGGVQVTTLVVPAGTYAVSFTLDDAIGLLTSGGGATAEAGCYVDLVNVQIYLPADGTMYDRANSNLISLTADTTFTVYCYTGYPDPVTIEFSWTNLTLNFTRLD